MYISCTGRRLWCKSRGSSPCRPDTQSKARGAAPPPPPRAPACSTGWVGARLHAKTDVKGVRGHAHGCVLRDAPEHMCRPCGWALAHQQKPRTARTPGAARGSPLFWHVHALCAHGGASGTIGGRQIAERLPRSLACARCTNCSRTPSPPECVFPSDAPVDQRSGILVISGLSGCAASCARVWQQPAGAEPPCRPSMQLSPLVGASDPRVTHSGHAHIL